VRLFAIPVRAVTLSKSRVKISVRGGEGCDTPSVTIIATMFKQQLTI
jgi:hypothetical protein